MYNLCEKNLHNRVFLPLILLVCSLWNHSWTSRKPWTKGRQRIPGSQRWKGYVSTKQRRQEQYVSGKSEWFVMLTGEPGRPGLPGLPATYTVEVPHRVQKREAGVYYSYIFWEALGVQRARRWALTFVFFISFRQWTGWPPQEGSPSSWQRLTGWNTTGSFHILVFFFFFELIWFSCFIFSISCSKASEFKG